MNNPIKPQPFCSIAILLLFLSGFTMLHAEAPELRNVMPNSWKKVTRLTAEEEQEFISRNSDLIRTIREVKLDWFNIPDGAGSLGKMVIYRQEAGDDVFYRVLRTNADPAQLMSSQAHFVQFLALKGRIVTRGSYNVTEVLQRYSNLFFSSIDIIPGKGKAKGILTTELRVKGSLDYGWSGAAYRKDQLYGTVSSVYYSIDHISPLSNGIQINASDCLVDPNIPLRYSFQNAFDGDPATSYVENTEDDLIDISISGSFFSSNPVKRVAIINGYAQNMALYKSNNRLQTILMFKNKELHRLQLTDNTISWQFIETDGRGFAVADIYKGEKYNDTCIAEYNICTEQNGWLFGDIDE